MTYDLFRLIEIKIPGYAGYAYTYDSLKSKYTLTAKPGELYLVYGLSDEPRQVYESINAISGEIDFVVTTKSAQHKWIPLNFYIDHNVASTLIWSGEEKESKPTEFTTNSGLNLNSVQYFWTESGRFMKDIIMKESDISRRGVPSDCNENYRGILSDEDRADADKFFEHKSYVTYATLEELSSILEKVESEWKSDILEYFINQRNTDINKKLDTILELLTNKSSKQILSEVTEEDYYDEYEEDLVFNQKYFLIQDLYKEIEGISLLVNGATSQYTGYSSIRVCYWVE